LVVGNYQPVAGAYFFVFVGVLIVSFNYLFVKYFFDKKVAILSSFLIAISPNFVEFTRSSRFFYLTVLLFYPFFYFLFKSSKEKKNYLFLSGVIFGVMLNFHLTPLIYFPFIILVFFKHKTIFKFYDVSKFIIGLFISQIPLLIHDAKNNFEMLSNFLIWIPYRIAGFIGIYPKNTLNQQVFNENATSFLVFLNNSFVHNSKIAGLIVGFVFVLITIFYLINYTKRKILNIEMSLLGVLLLGYLAIFVHGSPPNHYFLPLFPIPIILLSQFIINRSKISSWVIIVIVMFVSIVNIDYYFSDKWFYRYENVSETNFIQYKSQVSITKKIVNKMSGSEYSLHRVGENDHFDGDFAQNYQYLLWLYGNEPVNDESCKIIIIEDENKVNSEISGEIDRVDGVTIEYNCTL
jgi:hypothetical protein